MPEDDVRGCMGANCKNSLKAVTAEMVKAGKWTGTEAETSQGIARGQDTKMAYEDVARELSGARIAGGM